MRHHSALFALLLLLALPALGQDDLSWLAKPTPICADGAVTTACKCGGAKVTSGVCIGGTPYTAAYYVDSVAGSDAGPNPCTNSAAPCATLARGLAVLTNGAYLGLKRGSFFREDLTLTGKTSVTASAYGDTVASPVDDLGRALVKPVLNSQGEMTGTEADDRPRIDAASVVLNSVWTATGGYTNVWQTSETLTSAWQHGVYENGVRLTHVTTVALVESTAGSYTAPVQSGGGSEVVYIHPAASDDPTTNGKTYEMRRRSGITGCSGCSLISLTAQRQARADGSLMSFYYGRDLAAFDGVKHNFWVEGVCEDCVAQGNDAPTITGGSTEFISFPSGQGPNGGASRVVTYRRCHAIGEGNTYTLGYLAHTSGGGDLWVRIVYEDSTASRFGSGFSPGNTTTAIFKGIDVTHTTTGISTGTTLANLYVLGSTFNGTGIAPSMTRAIMAGASVTVLGSRFIATQQASIGLILSQGGGALDVRSSTIVWVDRVGTVWYAVYKDAGTSTVFQYNIISQSNYNIDITAAGGTWTADYNNYFNSPAVKFIFGATTYNSFDLYRAGVPTQDVHSITSDPQFTGALADGDTTISPTSPAYLAGMGADAPGVAAAVEAAYAALLAAP